MYGLWPILRAVRSHCIGINVIVAAVLLACISVSAQDAGQPAQPAVPLPPVLRPPAPTPAVPHEPQPALADLSADIIAWDSMDKAVTVDAGTPNSSFSFSFTNVSSEPVTILSVRTSCGCTTAQLPPMPWLVQPDTPETLNINMNLAGKNGTVIKSVTFQTDKGTKNLLVRTTIVPLPTSSGMATGSREQNQVLALVDPKAIFRGDCASCHVEPAKGKMGAELYTAACGICHEAEHRASSVPDLKVAKQERDENYWHNWIKSGRPGTMMAPFAISEGGILTDEQISSLVNHLMKAMPTKPTSTSAASVPAPAAH